jgi:hypothetical protein
MTEVGIPRWRRLWLPLLTLVVAALLGLSLLNSWQQPQTQNVLQLRAVDLQLQASVWQGATAFPQWFSQSTLAQAEQVYQRQQQVGQKALDPTEPEQVAQWLVLDLRLGVIQAERGEVVQAQRTWQEVVQRQPEGTLGQTAQVLQGLWGEPALIYPNAEVLLAEHLSGWFEQVALLRLYRLQQRQAEEVALLEEQQEWAADAVNRLVVLVGLPVVGGTLGQFYCWRWGCNGYCGGGSRSWGGGNRRGGRCPGGWRWYSR